MEVTFKPPWYFARYSVWVAFYATWIVVFAWKGIWFGCTMWICSFLFLSASEWRYRKRKAKIDKSINAFAQLLKMDERILNEHVRRAPLN